MRYIVPDGQSPTMSAPSGAVTTATGYPPPVSSVDTPVLVTGVSLVSRPTRKTLPVLHSATTAAVQTEEQSVPFATATAPTAAWRPSLSRGAGVPRHAVNTWP